MCLCHSRRWVKWHFLDCSMNTGIKKKKKKKKTTPLLPHTCVSPWSLMGWELACGAACWHAAGRCEGAGRPQNTHFCLRSLSLMGKMSWQSWCTRPVNYSLAVTLSIISPLLSLHLSRRLWQCFLAVCCPVCVCAHVCMCACPNSKQMDWCLCSSERHGIHLCQPLSLT